MFTDRSCHSTTYGPYGLLPTNKPNAACMCASGAPSFACELRWTLEMVIDVEMKVVNVAYMQAEEESAWLECQKPIYLESHPIFPLKLLVFGNYTLINCC